MAYKQITVLAAESEDDLEARGRPRRLWERCARELGEIMTEEDLRAAKGLPSTGRVRGSRVTTTESERVRYVVSKVGRWDENSFSFDVTEQRPHQVGHMPERWMNEWTATIVVDPNLDIALSDAFGQPDNELLERTILTCALRGPE